MTYAGKKALNSNSHRNKVGINNGICLPFWQLIIYQRRPQKGPFAKRRRWSRMALSDRPSTTGREAKSPSSSRFATVSVDDTQIRNSWCGTLSTFLFLLLLLLRWSEMDDLDLRAICTTMGTLSPSLWAPKPTKKAPLVGISGKEKKEQETSEITQRHLEERTPNASHTYVNKLS